MKKKAGFAAKLLALSLALIMLLGLTPVFAAGNQKTYTNAAEIATFVSDGYNQGTKGPITITKGTLKSGWSTKTVYLVTLSGTELVFNQSTEYITDLFCGFNLNNSYYANVVSVIRNNVPKNANLVLAGHSLGGMVAQQAASDSTIKSKYNVLNTVTFGSPLINGLSREAVKRLGDTRDVVPYLSVSTFLNVVWQAAGLNREDGGYSATQIVTAHCESYQRAAVWGAYDVTGTKNGSAKLTLNFATTKFYASPVIITE